MVSTHYGYLTMNTHWILTAVLHMAALIQTGESCMVSVTPTLVFATDREILTFNCTSSCKSLAWETRLYKVNSPPFAGNFSSLQVSVNSWEESKVQCLDNDATGDDVPRAIATVIPYALPSEVKIDVQKEMEEGQDYEVTCHVISVAPVRLVTVELHINNEVSSTHRNEGDQTTGMHNMNNTFTITANRQQTEFHCLAIMTLTGIANTTVSSPGMEVSVLYPPGRPEVISFENSKINAGASFKLSCNADAQPPPLYRWIVPPGATVTYSPDYSTITIGSASSAHSGNYTCVVSNPLGQSEVWTHVKLEEVTGNMLGIRNAVVIVGIVVLVMVVVLVSVFVGHRQKNNAS